MTQATTLCTRGSLCCLNESKPLLECFQSWSLVRSLGVTPAPLSLVSSLPSSPFWTASNTQGVDNVCMPWLFVEAPHLGKIGPEPQTPITIQLRSKFAVESFLCISLLRAFMQLCTNATSTEQAQDFYGITACLFEALYNTKVHHSVW